MARITDRAWRVAYRIAHLSLRVAWFIFRPRTRSAHVLVRHDRRVLLIQNSYKPGLSFPAGGLHRSETPVHAAARELREEVGISVTPESLSLREVIDSRCDFKTDEAHVFELALKEPPAIRVDGREVVRAKFLSLEDAVDERLNEVCRTVIEALIDEAGGPP